MNNLFLAGFHLAEIVDFLDRSRLSQKSFVKRMKLGLARGEGLALILESLKFSTQVVTQISLAQIHGDLAATLNLVEKHLRQFEKIRKRLIQVVTYPILLLLFLFSIMLGLKNYLLPQLTTSRQADNLAVGIINNLPLFFFSLMLFILFVLCFSKFYFRRKTSLSKFKFLARLPGIGGLVRVYLSAYFSREWGILLQQGLSLHEIFRNMPPLSSRIFSEIGNKLLVSLQEGQAFEREVRRSQIFTDELPLIIEYGDLKGRLGLELSIYSEECWEKFFDRLDRLMQLIQPLIFLFVALMIVLIYAAMLLPIYENINLKF